MLLLYFTMYPDDEIHHFSGKTTQKRMFEYTERLGQFKKECISKGKKGITQLFLATNPHFPPPFYFLCLSSQTHTLFPEM